MTKVVVKVVIIPLLLLLYFYTLHIVLSGLLLCTNIKMQGYFELEHDRLLRKLKKIGRY